jgi:hypothetical protein
MRGWSEAAIAHDVAAAVGDLGGDGVDPLERIENQLGGAASRIGRRGDPDTAFVVDLDGVDADRSPRDVTYEPLQRRVVFGIDGLVSVRREP